MKIDLHVHTTVSDGTDSPAQLVAEAAAAGVEVIGLCDHDATDGWEAAQAAGEAAGVRVLRGIEISCQVRGNSVHLLAYGCRADDPALADELARNRAGRSERVPTMLARLAENGMPVPEEVLAQLGAKAELLRELVFLLLGQREARELRHVIDVEFRGFGHPWGRISRDCLPPRYLGALVASRQLDGIEVDHQDHDPATREELRALAAFVGAVVTGSSDYHGVGKLDHGLGCNTTSAEALAELERRVQARGGVL